MWLRMMERRIPPPVLQVISWSVLTCVRGSGLIIKKDTLPSASDPKFLDAPMGQLAKPSTLHGAALYCSDTSSPRADRTDQPLPPYHISTHHRHSADSVSYFNLINAFNSDKAFFSKIKLLSSGGISERSNFCHFA